jgi:hypothetical protein
VNDNDIVSHELRELFEVSSFDGCGPTGCWLTDIFNFFINRTHCVATHCGYEKRIAAQR